MTRMLFSLSCCAVSCCFDALSCFDCLLSVDLSRWTLFWIIIVSLNFRSLLLTPSWPPHVYLATHSFRSRLSQPFPRYRHHLAFCIIFRPSPSLPGIRAFLFTTLTRGAPVACNHVPLPGTILVLLLCHRAATHNRRLARTLSVNGRWMKPPSGRCRPSLVHRSSWESSFVGTRILLSG